MIELRPYQKECLAAAVTAAKTGIKRQLFILPTGTGKTVIFSRFPKMLGGRRALIIAHRKELLDQAADQIEAANPDIRVEVEQAERTASKHTNVVVASIQSLSRSPKRLARLDPETLGLVVIDEVHHAVALTYLSLLSKLHLAPDLTDVSDASLSRKQLSQATRALFHDFTVPKEAPYLFGFTATSHRTDGLGLEYILDEVSYSKDMQEMMREGWLSKIKGFKIGTGVDLKGVKSSRGDFQERELSAIVNTPDRNDLAVKSFQALAPERQALVFCVDVKHTEDLCEAFQEAGVNAAVVVGTTPKDIRQGIIRDYKAGLIQVLCNCMVLTEGFDAPETSCLVMARPTQSSLLYTQMLGRGTRIAEGKENLLAIDRAHASRVGVATVNTLFGLPPGMDIEKDVLEAKDEFDEIIDDFPIGMEHLLMARSIEEVKSLAMEFSPIEQAQMPDYLQTRFAWTKTPYGYAMGAQLATVGVVVDMLEHGTVKIKERGQQVETLGTYNSEQEAISVAEDLLRERFPNDIGLLDKNAPWRIRAQTQPATVKQIHLATQLKLTFPDSISKADMTVLIGRALSSKENL